MVKVAKILRIKYFRSCPSRRSTLWGNIRHSGLHWAAYFQGFYLFIDAVLGEQIAHVSYHVLHNVLVDLEHGGLARAGRRHFVAGAAGRDLNVKMGKLAFFRHHKVAHSR